MGHKIVSLVMFVCYGLGLTTCSFSEERELFHYDINSLRNSSEQFIFDELVYIPLETNSNCFIGSIHKIILTRDFIFIFSDDLLYQFDINGKYIRKIGSIGKGPGEYGTILDIAVDEQSGKVFIFDNSGQKINVYNFSGEYLAQEGHNGFWRRFEVMNNMYVVNPLNFGGNEPCMLKIIAENDSVTCFKNNVIYEQQDFFLVYDIKNFQKLNNELIFHQQFNDTVYRFSPENKTLSVNYYFDFGNNKLPIDLLGSSKRFDKESLDYGYLSDITENNNSIFVTIFFKGEHEKYVINKETGKYYYMDKKQHFIWPKWSDEKGTLVSILQADILLEHKNKISDVKLKNILSIMNEEDNPIIILFPM